MAVRPGPSRRSPVNARGAVLEMNSNSHLEQSSRLQRQSSTRHRGRIRYGTGDGAGVRRSGGGRRPGERQRGRGQAPSRRGRVCLRQSQPIRRKTCGSPGTPPRARPGRASGSPEPSTSTPSPRPRSRPPRGRQRPHHPWRADRVAYPPARADHLRHRGRRALPASPRRDRGDTPGRPRVLRAGRGPLARRSPQPVHDPHSDAGGRRLRQPRRLRRARHRRGVRSRTSIMSSERCGTAHADFREYPFHALW
jgi:hypothetical protein